VRLTVLLHATVALEMGGTTVLTDPVLRGHVAFLRRTAPPPDAALLGGVRVALVSHLHHDHCDPQSLSLLGRDVALLMPSGTESFFRRHGFRNVRPMRPGESHSIGRLRVTATPAEHDGARHPFGHVSEALGFVVEADGMSVYFAGDTDLFDGMSRLRPDLDLALLPVAGWGRTLGPGHLDPLRAARAVSLLAPTVAVPIHWDGLRPFWHRRRPPEDAAAAPQAFAAEVARLGLPTRVEVLAPASSVWLP
jgi:L-ascorbate metabolism protein UlaG (beta-lactamase superfamily)